MFSGIRIRSFHGNGMFHQILLPDGTSILTDPFITGREDPAYTRETIEKADYILVTHTHFDHDTEVGYYQRKYGARVLVPAFSADAELRFHGIDYDHIFPVLPGETYTFDEFEVHCLRAKHNPTGGRVWDPVKTINTPEHKQCDDLGSIDSIDYAITTHNNFRLMTASGESFFREPFRFAEEFAPDLLIRQAGHRTKGDLFTGQQYTPEMLADLFLRYNAAVTVPGHYDVLLRRWGEEQTRAYFADVKRIMEEKRPGSTLLYPEPAKWYTIGVTIGED